MTLRRQEYDSPIIAIRANADQFIEKTSIFQNHALRRLGQAEQIVAKSGRFVTPDARQNARWTRKRPSYWLAVGWNAGKPVEMRRRRELPAPQS